MLFVSTEEIEKCEMVLEPRMDAKTVAGTRSHHSFVPVSSDSLQIRRISADVDGTSVKVTSSSQAQASQSFTHGQYLAAVYDQAWYLGIVEDISHENEDVLVNFMRSRNPGTTIHSFVWPSTRDEYNVGFLLSMCYVPCKSRCTSQRVESNNTNLTVQQLR